jgi:galactokinase
MTKEVLAGKFRERYNKEADYFFFCPGRVNLIGEHIDYNGGLVMPFAISLGSYVAVSFNEENVFRFSSVDFKETADIALAPSYTKTGPEWYNYPLGVIHELIKSGHSLKGMDMLFAGDLPVGTGLSSSASIEVLTAYMIAWLHAIDIDKRSIALLSKRVENEFIGLSSGIMDQYAVALGKKNQALLLDCDTITHEYMPFETGDYKLVIINSRKQRQLAESKYNERFAECREALAQLQTVLPVTHLCEISPGVLKQHEQLITNPVVRKRAWHVVTENDRVHQACAALKSGDVERLGELLYASHDSLRDDYEVSGKELDTIVEFAHQQEACIGARMTGAGFGGCAIALVKEEAIPAFSEQLISYYESRIGYSPEVIVSEIGEGVNLMI